ncbi:MAG TPA: gluconokinase [Nocardioidaceae bacterium]|nr:gluconokinase [Nocardioidaceae bacterium]
MTSNDSRPLVVVMGVSGSGKTTAGEALGAKLALRYSDADGFHPDANVEKMRAGVPLTDEDRWPWLDAVGEWLAEYTDTGAIVSCSALRREYRDRLRDKVPGAAFWHLAGPQEVVQRRMDARKNHFMPASLLRSQYETLEPLEDDEYGLTTALDQSVEALVNEFVDWLERHPAA